MHCPAKMDFFPHFSSLCEQPELLETAWSRDCNFKLLFIISFLFCNYFSGLIYNGTWPVWSIDSWWIPLLTALFGTLANILIVKMVLQQQQYSSFVIYIKVSLEVIALFILTNDNIEKSPSNMASLGLFITCCIIVILYGRKV